MVDSDLKKVLGQFENAFQRFAEAIREDGEKNSLYLDAAVQRFEFTFEMGWRTIGRFLKREGIEARTPREVFKEALKLGWLSEGDTLWIKMIDDRNLTTHTYDKKLALEVYRRIKAYEKPIGALILSLKSKI